MAVTSQQIADAAGVSRATVDRALKNRGRVSTEVAEKIKKIAEEMGYQPNQAARALALAKNPVKIGVILSSINTPFIRTVLQGVYEAQAEVDRRGGVVFIRTVYDISFDQMVKHIEELKRLGVKGIALIPAKNGRMKDVINALADKDNIPVVTLNADVSDSKRICFVGQENEKAGQVVAGLMEECLEQNSPVCVLGGSESNPAMASREEGFLTTIKELRPDIKVYPTYFVSDDTDNAESEQVTLKLLEKRPDLKGIYACTPAIPGVCRALYKAQKVGKIKLICHDLLEENIHYLRKGAINFLIGQEGHSQGYEPVMMLFRLFVEETEPAKILDYTSIIVKNRFNI